MDLREVAAAYQSIYLKEEVVEETTEINLSEEEILSIVEEAIDSLLEEGFSIEEIEELSEEIEESVLAEAGRLHTASAQQAGFKRIKDMESGGPGAGKVRGDNEIKKEKGGQAFLDKIAKAKAKMNKEEVEVAEAMTPKQKEMRAKFKAQQAKDDAATTASKNAELRRQKVEAAKDKVKSAVKAGVAAASKKAGEAKSAVKAGVEKAKETGREAKFQAVDKKVAAYANKRNLHPAPGLAARAKDPEKRRALRAKVAGDIADRVKSKVKDTAKAAADDAKETGKAAAKLGKDAAGAAKDTAKGVVGAVKDAASAAKSKVKRGIRTGALKLARAMKEEGGELDSFDTVITYLIDEEIASTFEEANALMTKLSAETISEIHESQLKYITEISAQLAHTASMKADEVARKARISGDKETAAKKVQQASRIYKGVGPRRAKERMEKEGN